MALIPFVSGPYAGVFASESLGCTEDGYRLLIQNSILDLSGDCYGDSVIDSIYRGGNAFITLVSIQAALAQLMLNPFGDDIGAMGLIGSLVSGGGITGALSLTAKASTSAAGEDLATITAAQAQVSSSLNGEINFNARARVVPLMFRLYPSTVSSVDRWFAFT